MSDEEIRPSISVMKNGPYVVKGGAPLALQTITSNEHGSSWEWTAGQGFSGGEQYALCRCGQSHKNPFCDGTHASIDFDGTETAPHDHYRDRAQVIEGQTVALKDDRPLCAFARFCDNDTSVWKQIHRPASPALEQLLTHEVTRCPSGRLVLVDKESNTEVEPDLPASIGVVEDPGEQCSGPLWIRGGIPIVSASGEQYEIRNRVTLCRCGASNNKPFCDGSHASVRFADGLANFTDV